MTRATPLTVTLLLVVAVATPASADYYRWTDDRGVPHYVEGLDNVPERYRPAAVPIGMRRSAPTPAPLESTAAAKPSGSAEIGFAPGQRIMVNVRINDAAPARLQLDTGADRTLISPRALQAAGVSLTRGTGPAQVIGVTGTDRAQVVVVDSLDVSGAVVGKMPVIAYDMSVPDSDGLLGRDFLDRFIVNIDSSHGILTLGPK
ncbi:MAG: aspartyl protease family protein [Candidatus Rokubacteria bacterium]|nr:aspartyl protease family protein [Candidatus Rokubacteria bacterium]